ncbi:uncharacterized protein LOC135350878 isoform X2 [Halichondria panicea]|uniref:uncharacterized protein LOC135350878 isoform X2 n=1 Tax=Halichondria panicea TaxID=6063 RepID=UPI00312B831A
MWWKHPAIVIIACRSQLVSELQKGDLNSLADWFYQNGMLALPELGDIQSEKEQVEKARRLTNVLENRVHHVTHRYQHFTKMLTQRSSQFHGLTVILENKRSELELEEGESRRTSTKTYISRDSGLSELEDSYICIKCFCGNCATNNFVQGENCPDAPPKSPPFLSMCSQADANGMKFSDYRQSIMEQTRDINSKHKALLLHTTQELKEKVPLDVVKDTVQSLLTPPHVKKSLYTCIYKRGTKGRLRDVGTHDDLRLYLENNFCCWFNIQLIADLRKVLLLKGKRDDSYICHYKEHVAQYLKRCCVKHTICDTENGKEYMRMEIVCRVSTDFTKLKTEQIRIFEYTLRQYVSMPDCSKTVDEQSGELIFTEKEPTTNQQVIIHQDLGATESIDNKSTDSILQNVHGPMEIRRRD